MKLLEGKLKDEFLEWFSDKYLIYFNVYRTKQILMNTLITEFLDSIGVYIDVSPIFDEEEMTVSFDSYVDFKFVGNFETRDEAYEQAIIKANKILK